MSSVVITGSSTGIGRAIAVALSKRFDVVVNSRTDMDGGRETLEAIRTGGGTAHYVQADVSTESGVDKLFTAAQDNFGVPIALVNNAGATRSANLTEWTASHWHDMLCTNLVSCALTSQRFVAELGKERGSIVNIASIRGVVGSGRIGIAAYSAAKAGVINLTATMGRALAPHVTVNCISPGFVETRYLQRVEVDLVNSWRSSMPIHRFIEPNEIAQVTEFLITQSAITGENIVVDGGWTKTGE